MQYENRIKEIDELKEKIDKYKPLSENALKQIKEYYRIGLTYTSRICYYHHSTRCAE